MKFKKGDKVKCLVGTPCRTRGKIYTVTRVTDDKIGIIDESCFSN